jgi:thiol-disulfide isomerase/thioredoxin
VLTFKRRTVVWSTAVAAVLLAGGAVLLTTGAATWGGSSGNGTVVYYPPGDRKPIPAVTGTTITGSQISMAGYRGGDVLVVNFWGSWCAPCRAEAPMLAATSASYASRGVRFLGVDEQDNPDSARAFDSSFGVQYPSINDAGAQVTLDFNGITPISATPTTVVIDRSGRVAEVIVGQATYSELSSILNRLTAKGAAA